MPGRLDTHSQPNKLKIIPENGVLLSISSPPFPSPGHPCDVSCQGDPAFSSVKHLLQYKNFNALTEVHFKELPINLRSKGTPSAAFRTLPHGAFALNSKRQSRLIDPHECIESNAGPIAREPQKAIAHSSIVPNYGKPICPVMGSKAPRMASNGCCAAFESSAQQRQQFPVSQYRGDQDMHCNPPTQSALMMDDFGSHTT